MNLRRFLACLMMLAGVVWLPALSAEPDFTPAERAVIASLSLDALPPLSPDTTNRFADSPGPAAFGATLFFEQRLSRSGAIACATCHRIDLHFQDGLPRAVAAGELTRRTMPLAGVARNEWFFWDGRRDSLWAQALVPLENPLEHGGTRAFYAHLVAEKLRARYEHVFGPLPDLSTVPLNASPQGSPQERDAWAALSPQKQREIDTVFVNLGKSIAAFERTIEAPQTRFDRFARALGQGAAMDPEEIFSDEEVRGLRLFIGKAGCVACHLGPRLTDGQFHATGVPPVEGLPPDLGREEGVGLVLADPFNCLGAFRDGGAKACKALNGLNRDAAPERGAYKTPSLRGVADRPPYMHAGQFATLEEVVVRHAPTPTGSEGASAPLAGTLTQAERAALVAFLKTLAEPGR